MFESNAIKHLRSIMCKNFTGLSISHIGRLRLSNLAVGLASKALNKSSDLFIHISATSGPRVKYDISIHIYISWGVHF